MLSPDENQRTFSYSWTKNDEEFSDNDREIVEDLLPSGSRLLIKNAQVSTKYTCHVTNKAGTSSRSVYLFVAKGNSSGLVCPSSALEGVKWNQTFSGYFNLQICPSDALGGYTKRNCICDKSTCHWGQPNYAQCQSVHLIQIYDMLMKIQLGYQEQLLMDIYSKLYTIVQKARDRMFAGDLDITAKNLYMSVTIARDFPVLADRMFRSEDLVDFLNILLEEAVTMTKEEKQELLVGGRIIQVAEIMIDLNRADLITLKEVEHAGIGLRIAEMQPLDMASSNDEMNKKEDTAGLKESYIHGPVRTEKRSIENLEDESSLDEEQEVLVMRYDQSILPLLDRQGRDKNSQEIFVSDVYSYIPLSTTWVKPYDKYVIDIPHKHVDKWSVRNISNCLSWERASRDSTEGRWVEGSCTIISLQADMTRCLCPVPGHFTVVITPLNYTVVEPPVKQGHLALIITSVLSLSCLTVALIIYLFAWRYLSQEKHNIHFNFIVALTGMNLMCVMCLAEKEMMCLAGKMLLQLFTVAAFAFLLLDAIQLFTDIHARAGSRVILGACKSFLIGWGVPVFSVVCVVILMEVSGYDRQCCTWCWWTPSHHHFYSVLLPIVLFTVGHTVVLVYCIFMVSKWNDEWRFRRRRKSLLEVATSEALLVLLIAFVISGVMYDDKKAVLGQAIYVIFNLLMAFATVLFLVVFKKPMRLSAQAVCSMSKSSTNKLSFSGFRAFILPGNQETHARVEVDRIHEYCDRVDRQRYTNEHKRQLRFLLNSNSSSGSSGGAVSSPPHGDQQRSRKRQGNGVENNRNELNIDSGISEGTESEKSSTTPQSNGIDCQSETRRSTHGSTAQDNLMFQESPPSLSEKGQNVSFHPSSSSASSSASTSSSTPSSSITADVESPNTPVTPEKDSVHLTSARTLTLCEMTETDVDITESTALTSKPSKHINREQEANENNHLLATVPENDSCL